MREELINALTRVDGLRVASRTASFQFRGAGADIRAVGHHLCVGTLLEGSVRKAGDRLRVTVQLVEVATGYHRWSQRFDRLLDDAFAIQDEIAESVAASLRGNVLTGREKQALQRPQTMEPSVSVSFGRYRFDPGSGRLWSRKREIRLTPKASAVLKVLVTHAGQPVPKEDLFAAVWNDTVVSSDDALTSCIQELRRAFADDAKEPRFIETRHRRGYRFVAQLTGATSAHETSMTLTPPASPCVQASVGASMETDVESVRLIWIRERQSDASAGIPAGMRVQLLGPLTISRDGVVQVLPASRKVRALFAYLALAPQPVGRSHLCELLWDVPHDPRGELRWCVSKIRRLLDEPDRRRVETVDQAVKLDLSDCFVDVIEIARAVRAGIETLDAKQLTLLSKLFVGDFLDRLEIGRSPQFNGWLVAQRRRFRACHAAILEHLVRRLPTDSEAAFDVLETWLELAPFDRAAHEMVLNARSRSVAEFERARST